jgi:hypothetical protein
MNRFIALALVLVLVLLTTATPAARATPGWSLYVLEKGRKGILKKARRREVTADGLIGGTIIDTIWITRDVARALVSQKIDDERISTEEADRYFALLRPGNCYHVHVRYSTLAGGPELNGSGIFLQRADNRDVFSRGKLADALVFDSGMKVTVQDVNHVLAFPKESESGESIVRGLDDKIQVSLKTQYKNASITEYSVRDLVTGLGDL